MTINIKNIINIVAKKAHLADSSESANSLSSYLNILQRQGKGLAKVYSSLPNLVNEGFDDQDRLAIVNGILHLRKNAGWYGGPGGPFQGSNYGFSVFRKDTNPGTSELERFPFASTVTSVNFASIGTTPGSPFSSAKSRVGGGISDPSTTNGYQTGGQPPGAPNGNVDIFKFNMTTGTPVVVYGGTLTVGRYSICNHSDTENAQGFTSGGREVSGPPNPTPYSTVCEKFSFTTEAPVTDVGNLSSGRIRGTGITDNTNGRAYSIGGQALTQPLALAQTVDQFPFASPFTTATDIGDIGGTGVVWGFGGSSLQNGYVGGGDYGTPNNANGYLSRFPFSAPFTTSTQTGNLLQKTVASTTSCSITDMYITGGWAASDPVGGATQYSSIDKFSFASENPTVSVATISPVAQAQTSVSHGSGHQY